MAARPLAKEDPAVELVKCAVVELTLPIYSITLTTGFLLLGELNGVRVFPLRPLIKGGNFKKGAFVKKRVSSEIDSCQKNLPNGVIVPKSNVEKTPGPESVCSCRTLGGCAEAGVVEGETDDCHAPSKLKTLRIKQVLGDQFSIFVVITDDETQTPENSTGPLKSLKAVSIHLLSQKRFLVLDSAGNMHVFSLHDTSVLSQATAQCSLKFNVHKRPLDHTMEVQMLAVLPDNSAKTQVVWISDGNYSMHLMLYADIESPVNEKDASNEIEFTISAVEAVFMSEKIQDIVSISANSVLALCQGSIFLYAVA